MNDVDAADGVDRDEEKPELNDVELLDHQWNKTKAGLKLLLNDPEGLMIIAEKVMKDLDKDGSGALEFPEIKAMIL